jgi:hypothetical protein
MISSLVLLMKFIISIMLLLLTFITHTLLSYINTRIGKCKKLSSSIVIEAAKLSAKESAQSKTESTQNNTQADFEPELFQFNESFDVNLLNLKCKRHQLKRTPSSSSTNSTSYLLSSSSTSSIAHTDLIRNLNKLYNNENNNSTTNTHTADYFYDNNNYDEEFLIDDLINSTALFLNKNSSQTEFDLTSEAANATIICANQTNEIITHDEDEYFYNDNNLFKTFIHQTILSSSFKAAAAVESRLLFAPSVFRSSPKSTAALSSSNKSGLRKFRAKKQQKAAGKKSAKRSVAFKKSTKRGRNNKLNLKSKPIDKLLNNIEPVFVKMPAKNNNQFYKRSFKVEKLLNDSRGMKKYLIDYDCMFMASTVRPIDCESSVSMSIHENDKLSSSNVSMCDENEIELTLDSGDMFGLEFLNGLTKSKPDSQSLKINQSTSFSSSSSNRCSSGYLSDSN